MCLGIPGRIVELVDGSEQRAVIEVEGGLRREISMAVIGTERPDGATVGDWVLVHVGFAMSRLDEDEAAATIATLRLFGSVYEDELEQLAAGAGYDEELEQLKAGQLKAGDSAGP